jgi:hypothetical protein
MSQIFRQSPKRKTTAKARTPVKKIARLTKRSEAALRSKASSMGMRLGHQR